MKSVAPILFLTFAFVYLAQSSAVGRDLKTISSNDNLIDSDLSSAIGSRMVDEQSNELAEVDIKSLTKTKQGIFKLMILPTLTFFVTTLVNSKLTIAHLLFDGIFGLVATVAVCTYTPLCSISIGSETFPQERIMELMSPENLGMITVLVNNAVDTYEAVRKLN